MENKSYMKEKKKKMPVNTHIHTHTLVHVIIILLITNHLIYKNLMSLCDRTKNDTWFNLVTTATTAEEQVSCILKSSEKGHSIIEAK